MSIVLSVQDVWKKFRIPHEKHERTILNNIAGVLAMLEGRRYNYEEFWAIKDISFDLEEGESLGIIGRNGSGKSTLLKLIARIMRPDTGKIITAGLVVPVLELGIGFHNDLTVKENAVVYGVIMGLRRSRINARVDSILSFAGLERFQDAKLKTLSTGMQVRLAFSIAIQTDADIFLVDEALAVGDMEFQEKCLNTFREFKKQGKSIVLVSHSMNLIQDFCEKTLYLENGETAAFGESSVVTNKYLKDAAARSV